MKKCVFAGTFDPPTTGHEKLIADCLKIFDEVVVAVMVNRQKTPFLSEDDRAFLLKKLYADEPRVKVITFEGAAADLLAREKTPFYVRGIRNTVDLEYENANLYASRRIYPEMTAVYLPAGQESTHISSTLVKNCIAFRKDFSMYIPQKIYGDFCALLERKNVRKTN